MRAVLIGSAGPVLGREYPLELPVITIGRRDENTIVIKDPTVSRNHAEIHRTGDDYVLIDKGSTSGVTVNGAVVTGQHYLRDGDRIGIGGSAVFLTQLQPVEGKTITFSSSQMGDSGRTQFISRDKLEDPRPAAPSSTVPFMAPPPPRPDETMVGSTPLVPPPPAAPPASESFNPPPVAPPVSAAPPMRDPTPAPPPATPSFSSAPPPVAPPLQDFGAGQRLPEAGETRDWQLSQLPNQGPPRFDAPPPDPAPPQFSSPGPAYSAAPELPRFGSPQPPPPAFGGAPMPPPIQSNPPLGPSMGALPPLGAPPPAAPMGGFGAQQPPQAMMAPPAPPPAPASSSRIGLIIGLAVLVVLILIALVIVVLLVTGTIG